MYIKCCMLNAKQLCIPFSSPSIQLTHQVILALRPYHLIFGKSFCGAWLGMLPRSVYEITEFHEIKDVHGQKKALKSKGASLVFVFSQSQSQSQTPANRNQAHAQRYQHPLQSVKEYPLSHQSRTMTSRATSNIIVTDIFVVS